jgi:hypothetical protein
MIRKTYLALSISAVALAILALPAQTQEKTSPTAQAVVGATKKSTDDRVEERAKPAPDEKVPVPQERRTKGIEARSQASDFWITPRGAFHLTGATGKGIYDAWGLRDDTFRFVDARPVGGRVGWTYRADGWAFYMFFSQNPSAGGKYELLWSFDNENFNNYGWAE